MVRCSANCSGPTRAIDRMNEWLSSRGGRLRGVLLGLFAGQHLRERRRGGTLFEFLAKLRFRAGKLFVCDRAAIERLLEIRRFPVERPHRPAIESLRIGRIGDAPGGRGDNHRHAESADQFTHDGIPVVGESVNGE